MKLLSVALLLSWLLPVPAAAQDVGTITLLEGSLRIIRGTTAFQAVEGMRLRKGDFIESSNAGFAQLEFVGGAIVALGPLSRYQEETSERRSGQVRYLRLCTPPPCHRLPAFLGRGNATRFVR
jgi:hypothetical protein